jgi:hypothetical protein
MFGKILKVVGIVGTGVVVGGVGTSYLWYRGESAYRIEINERDYVFAKLENSWSATRVVDQGCPALEFNDVGQSSDEVKTEIED